MPSTLRARARLRRALATTATTVVVTASFTSGSASAGISGDHHSPTVVLTATAALAARDAFATTGTPGDFTTYLAARDATADAVAAEMALDPLALRDAWAGADLSHQTAVLAALTELGTPYRFAASDPSVGFDCSGLTAYAWARAGVAITHQSGAQIHAAAPRDHESAEPGDLAQYPGHVMLYLGVGDAIVHAVNRTDDVELDVVRRDVRFGDPTG